MIASSAAPSSDPRLDHLAGLSLKRLDDAEDAGLLICSLPVPPGADPATGFAGLPTWTSPLGAWPEALESPRRLLMVADAPDGRAPATLTPGAGAAPTPGWEPPTVEKVLFDTCKEPDWAWDCHYLRVSWGGQSLGLALGMWVGDELHWWEGCHLVVEEESPTCRVVEMGGMIPRDLFGTADLERWPGHENPYLHKHNWLNGLLRLRLHANGVVEILARHINTRFVDDGCALEDVRPVLGFRLSGEEGEDPASRDPGRALLPKAANCDLALGAFDGSQARFGLGGIQVNLAETAGLASAEHPGQIVVQDGFLLYQPYEGPELYSGIFGRQRLGDEWLYHAKDHTMPKGMARTLRLTASMNPARPPVVRRYLPPAWWYGACAEFSSTPLLPVNSDWDDLIDWAFEWMDKVIVRGGFEDGNLPRNGKGEADERNETSWEGELPGGFQAQAWARGNAREYANAENACYYFSDCGFDHASKLIRMHGYSPPAISLPMQRIHALVTLWLDTGWPHLLQQAEASIDNAYWLHKNSWPRSATGRDSCFIRGAVLLYRYTGDRGSAIRARDALKDVMTTQQPDGSFRDQGGGTGIHGWPAYITKPWMNCMVAGPMLDYLEVFPDDTVVAEAFHRQIDWFMAERWFHQGANGWSYKHFCKGERRQYSPREGGELTFPSPGLWHLNYLARMFTWAAERWGNTEYFDAFMESFNAARSRGGARTTGDHGNAQNLQYLPWTQARLWRARLAESGRVELRPQWLGDATPREAVVQTPAGPVTVRWEDGAVHCEPAGAVDVCLE